MFAVSTHLKLLVLLRAGMQEEYFAWSSLLKSLDSSLVAGGLQEDHFSDTLGTSSLVGDHKRDQTCIDSLFQFRSNLKDLRDQYDML